MLLGTLVLVVVHISVVTCAMLADVQRLLDDLFAPNVYNKEIRGTLDQSQPTLVSVDLGPKNIKSLREVEETLEMVSVIFLTWTDQRLAWDPAHYNDTRVVRDKFLTCKVFRPATSVRRPDVILENPAPSGMLYKDIDRAYTVHTYTGQVSIALGDLIATNCLLDMTSYPWDEHWCAVTLIVMGYTADHVKLVSVQKREMAILPGYEPSSSWSLIRMLTLFISMVGEKLPSNGDGIASLSYFLDFAMFISGVTCLCNLVTLKLSSKATSGKPVPSTLQALVNCGKRSTKMLLCTNKNARMNSMVKENDIRETNDVVEIGQQLSGVKKDSQVESRPSPEVSWMDASRWFDGVCVITTAAFLILGGFMFTYNVINGQIP
ncbi:acetylcholine receptor subunit beta-like [Mya arenaria]|uniref:acetylcholine receptor subunit beta-like n=1 Tax=Mya arenaria TaxID=6604 RepID=UPI0022E42AF2|nr:acetylcholine receptor subunit beta-like [Mya arenaria]